MSLDDRLKHLARDVEAEIPVPPGLEERLLAALEQAQNAPTSSPNISKEATNVTTLSAAPTPASTASDRAARAAAARRRVALLTRWVAVAAVAAVIVAVSFISRQNVALANRIQFTGVNPPAEQIVRPTGPADAEKLKALLPKMVPLQYPDAEHSVWELVSLKQAADANVYGEMVANFAGAKVAASTWVVQLHFPKLEPSASLSAGQLFLTKTNQGWVVWFKYH